MAELSLEHVSFLAHHLSPYACVWRRLGTALNFQQQDLDNIQSCVPLLSSSPYSFMQRLVEEWLEGKYPHTAPPTLANLLKALNSNAVGLGTLATQIRASLPQHNQSVGVKVVEIASVSDNCSIMFNQSDTVQVIESTGVHFKVETSPKLHAAFQWKNTGLVPIGGLTNTPTLHIPKANIDMDGSQYSCVIKIKSNVKRCRTISTATLRVSCPQLDQFKESLASIYLAQPEVPQDSWPPVSNKTYINLALIKQQQAINYGGEYARLTIRGDMDDILHHKKKLEYKNIFDGLRSGSLLLIEGRPGSGKTTFVHKITRDWAASEVQGPRRLVLLVSLRVLNSWERPVTLEDILNLLSMKVSPIILEERNGRGMCFIFDGLDEFSPLEGKESIVYKIINKTYLPQSIVIVASRPAALVKLRQRADKVVEVIGFLKDQIFDYIENYQFSDTSKADKLKVYLLSHPNVLHMCYLPIHAAMVAFLFDIMGTVPRTETEIYTHFTRFTLMRSLSKHKGQDELEDMGMDELLSGEERELFSAVCEHALEITMLNKQVLDQDKKMKLLLQSKDIKGISLGLVTVDRTAGLYGFKNIYTFLHLTYQEYLAAHHISTLSDEDQHKLIKQYGDMDHMQVVWKFYYGLVNFEGHEYKIEAFITIKRKQIGLYDIQCAYESQQEIVCNLFMTKMNARVVLEDQHLTTTDFTALGYLLANSSMLASVSLIKCDLNTESAKTLLAEIGGKPLSLNALCCESNTIDSSALILLLRNNSEPVSLSLIKSDLKYTKSVDTETGGKLSSLNTLHCESNKIDLSALILLLRNCSEPVSLFLTDCDINNKAVTTLQKEGEVCLHTLCYKSHEADFKSLSKLLSQQHSLESLEISCTEENTVYHDFSGIVSTSLTNLKKLCLTNIRVKLNTFSRVPQLCKKLTFLTLNGVFKEYDNIEPFLAEVSRCKKLEKMSCTFSDSANYVCIRTGSLPDIRQDNSLCIYGVRGNNLQTLMLEISSERQFNMFLILAASVSDFSVVEKLILKHLEMCDAKHFASNILSHCAMLQELDLSHTRSQEEIKFVLTGLKNCSNLKKLVLSHRHIKTNDACVLASYLQHWPKLQELHLRECGIEEEGAKAIADNIRYCPKLTEVDLSQNDINNETIQVIKSCLQSHNEVTESSLQIRDSLPQYDQSVGAEVFEIASVSRNGDITFNRSNAIRVKEGICVHLKVKTNPKEHEFSWNCTGLVPTEGITNRPTLHIPKANIDMDGSQCFCVIGSINNKLLSKWCTTTTTPVTLRVSCPQLDQFKESLAYLYLAQPEVIQDSWPPVSNKTYINLALIKQQQAINYGGEYARLTIRGDMDDILHHKKKLEYKNIFDGLRSGSLLLIEGRPGSGKTTFVHKITRDWATSEVQGPRRLVLLVSLRVLNSWERPVTLEDILNLLSMKVSPIILEERNGRGMCFIFDGLDEFSPLEGKESIVYKIINKTYLPQSIVIVASRPAALVKLRQRADKVVEVIGFLKDQIFDYIENYQFSDTSKADKLKVYLLSHPNVLHMCYLPIHVAMVAFLFDIMGTVPHTETEIYTHFTRFTLMRSLSKHEGQDELEDMGMDELLSGEERELFSAVCEHALEITKSKKQVLDQDKKMKLLLQSKDIKGISLGLVTVDRTAGLYGFKNIYTFLHLTYQEYLAAHHISTLSDKDQHKLIKQYGDMDHMQVVWKFYYGLVNFEEHEYKIEAFITIKRKQIGLYDIQCAYESQQEIVCNLFMTKMNARVVLEDQHLTTTDFTALGYLLANSSMLVSLSLIKCDLNAESAITLLAEIGGKPLSLNALRCESNTIDSSALILLLRNNSEPVSLSLIKSDLKYTKSADTETGGKLSSLNTLHCESNKIDLSALILLLRNCSEPVSLFLADCDINNKAVTTLQKEGEVCLHTLCYKSREVDFKSLSKLLSQQHSLESLEISCTEENTVYHDFSGIVSTSLTNLKKLCLTNVRVKLDTFSRVPQLCKKLTFLTLNGVFKEYDLFWQKFQDVRSLKKCLVLFLIVQIMYALELVHCQTSIKIIHSVYMV